MIRPPVEIKWTDVGRSIEGIFEKTWDAPTHYGKQRFYLVKGEKRSYNMPGTTQLNAKMSRVKAGDRIRVTFTGETRLEGARSRKEFTVEVDDEGFDSLTACKSEIKKWSRPTGEDVKSWHAFYDEGNPLMAVAEKFKREVATVSAHFRRLGLKIRTRSEALSLSQAPSRETITQAVDMYRGGLSAEDIASRLIVDASTIRQYLHAAGIELRTPRAQNGTADHPAQWKTLYESGLTAKQIGERFGVHTSTVTRELHKLSVPIRGRYGPTTNA